MIIRPETVTYRIKRGTSFADIPSNPPPALAELDSPFQYAEYLSLKVRHDPHDIEGLVKVPGSEHEDGSPAASGSNGPRKGNEKDLWIYEHLRRLPIDLTALVTSLLGVCTAESCPSMKADQWQYLCVAHGSEGAEECSAIDYILHTLDSTTSLLNSSETFPSRLQIPTASLAHFPSLFRRLSRIFSHAYYHHREVFSLAEAETSLYARFWALCERYDLVNTKLLIIPREVVAEAIDGKAAPGLNEDEDEDGDGDGDGDEDEDEEEEEDDEDDGRDSRRREKGESGPRPHSLDRHPRPHKLDDLRQKGEGTVKGWPAVTGSLMSTTASGKDSGATPTTDMSDPIATAEDVRGATASNAKTLGRSTVGRKGRGTMLWTSDNSDPIPSLPTAQEETSGAPLERTESVETAILVDDASTSTSNADAEVDAAPDVPEPAVPKDEIELLEEEGKIPPKSSVSPLAPPTLPSGSSSAQVETTETTPPDSDEMHEVALNEDSTPDPTQTQEGGSADGSTSEPAIVKDQSEGTEMAADKPTTSSNETRVVEVEGQDH